MLGRRFEPKAHSRPPYRYSRMKQSLQLKIGQSLTMTPQLQQAIRLLQLSSLELTSEVNEALESNMMLESDEETPVNGVEAEAAKSNETSEKETDKVGDEIPEDLPVDTEWTDIYDSMPMPVSRASSDQEEFDYGNVRGRPKPYVTT